MEYRLLFANAAVVHIFATRRRKKLVEITPGVFPYRYISTSLLPLFFFCTRVRKMTGISTGAEEKRENIKDQEEKKKEENWRIFRKWK